MDFSPSICLQGGRKAKGSKASLKCLANDLPESGPHKSYKMLYFNNGLEKLFSLQWWSPVSKFIVSSQKWTIKRGELAVYQLSLTIANKVWAFNVKYIFNIKILRLNTAKGFLLPCVPMGVMIDGAWLSQQCPDPDVTFVSLSTVRVLSF